MLTTQAPFGLQPAQGHETFIPVRPPPTMDFYPDGAIPAARCDHGRGGGVVKSERDDTPVLITEAARSYEDEYAARKRKYLTMMLLRMPCLILAGIFHDTWWLALAFVALSIPLPWIAVLIANDAPPRKT